MFGIIFHWGLYSIPAFDDTESAKRRFTQNGSEWYLKRLTETGDFRPISGWKETQDFHNKTYGNKKYEDFASDFQTDKWNPDQWMELCKSVGASYVILTAKHHDGYCLWDTKTTKFNSVETGNKDLIKLFADSAKKYNLKFGIYYSWTEFNKNCIKSYVDSVMYPQVLELIKYRPDIWWFDGDWNCKSQYSIKKIEQLCDLIRKDNLDALINDRLGKNDKFKDPNFLGKASYRVYQDRFIPSKKPEVPWEHINTIGMSWGRNKCQTKKDYKTPEELLALYNKVTSMNGRFLLNLGPNNDGTLDEFEVETLKKFSELIKLK